MINQTELEEKQYLEDVKAKLRATLEHLDSDVRRRAKDIKEQKAYLWENKTGMDHVEKILVRQAVAGSGKTSLLEKNDHAFMNRIRAKASVEFLNKLDEFITHIENTYFAAKDFKVSGCLVPAWFMDERFKAHFEMPIFKRLEKIAKDIESNIKIYYNHESTPQDREEIKTVVRFGIRSSDCPAGNGRSLYDCHRSKDVVCGLYSGDASVDDNIHGEKDTIVIIENRCSRFH